MENSKDTAAVFRFQVSLLFSLFSTIHFLLSALCFLSCLTPARADLSTLPTNTWVNVTPTYSGAPNGGHIFPQGWNNKGTYDPLSQRVIVMDKWRDTIRTDSIYANALMAYDPASNSVTVLKVSNWFDEGVICTDGTAGCGVTAPILPDNINTPTPVDRHPLGSVTAVPDDNAVFIINGLNQTAVGPTTVVNPNVPLDKSLLTSHPNDSWEFDLNLGAWTMVSNATTLAPTPPNVDSSSPAVMIFDSANHRLLYFEQKNTLYNGTETWQLNPQTRQWSVIAQDPSSLTVNTSASGIAYDSKRGRIVTFGGGAFYNSSSNLLNAYTYGNNHWVALASCPEAAGAPGFDYDSNHDIFLALINQDTWIYDPKADAWTQIASPIDRSYAVAYQSVTYDPAHDVFVFQGGTWGAPKWALFRYSSAPSAPTIIQQPSPVSVPAGQSAAFTVSAAGTPAPTYQWQSNASGSFTAISGATSAVYTLASAQLSNSGTQFQCVVTNSQGSVTSNPATLTVTPATPPTIQSPPQPASANPGQSASFSVTAAGSAPFTYQWQMELSGGSSFTPISGATSSSYTTAALALTDNGDQFEVIVTNSAGSVTSTPALLTVTNAPLAPTIIQSPQNQTVSVGQNATFTVLANGSAPLSYQWQYLYVGSWVNVGTNSASYTIPNVQLSQNGWQYRCAVTNGSGNVTSAVAILTIGSAGSNPPTNPTPVTYPSVDLSRVQVYPNPWRSDKHTGKIITFNNLPANSRVKIFTTSGHLARDLGTVSGQVTWDLANDSGNKVASGIYVYLITVGDTGYGGSGQKLKGKVAVIR